MDSAICFLICLLNNWAQVRAKDRVMNTVGLECFVKEMQDIDVEQDSNPCLTNCYTIISVTCLTSNGKLHEQD